MPHRVTIKDIARLAGVSTSTVSRALIEPPVDINPETRARILALCAQEGYQANALARGLHARESRILGLILPDVTNPYYAELALHIQNAAWAQAYQVILCNSLHDRARTAELLAYLAGRQVDGVLLAGSAQGMRAQIAACADRFPIVLLGTPDHDPAGGYAPAINAVCADSGQGAFQAVAHLYALGHREILFLGCRPQNPTHRQRQLGYEAAMRAHGLRPRTLENPAPGCSVEAGCALAHQMFATAPEITAVCAASDLIALGAVRAADEAGRRVPQDLSVVGFDNISLSLLPGLALTTVDPCKDRLCRTALDLLLRLLRGETDGATVRLLPPILRARDSTAPPRA